MAILTPDKGVYEQLKKLFNLPGGEVSMTIHLAVDEFVTIDCEYYADKGTGERITQTFNLVPAETEVVDVTNLESSAREYRRVPLSDD